MYYLLLILYYFTYICSYLLILLLVHEKKNQFKLEKVSKFSNPFYVITIKNFQE